MNLNKGLLRADSCLGGKKILGSPSARAGKLKIFTLNRKDWISVAEWLGLDRKGLIWYDRQIMILPTKTKTYAT